MKKCAFLLLLAGFLLSCPSQGFSKPIIPFGLCPKYNPRIMYQFYQPFVDYLSEDTPYQFEIKLSRTYQETIDRLGRGEVSISSCGPVPYIKARVQYGVKPLVRALSKNGKPYYQGIIVVRKNSPIRRIEDLTGKRFAFGQTWSTAGHILPMYYLAIAKVSLKDLNHYSFLRHHDSVVQAVLKGEFDAGAVKDIIAYKYQEEGLRFIHVTDPIPTVLIAVRDNTPKAMVESVREALLKLDPRIPAHRERMVPWDEEFKYGFTQASDSDYDSIRKILRIVEEKYGMKGPIRE